MMKPWVLASALNLLVAHAALAQDDPDKVHVRVAKKVAPATVYIEGGRQRGSGVLIDKSGIILTSPTACGTSSTTVTVIIQGNRSYPGKVMGRANDKELVLVKIDAKEDLPFIELGDSKAVRLGQVSYVFGDSYDSLRSDDQAAMSMGVVSGIYELGQKHAGSAYMGPVLETSAAVNPNQDGGPLVDREGRLLGIVTLNYDDSKFTGLAVPVHVFKPALERIRKEYVSSPVVIAPVEEPAKPAAPKGEPYLGLEVRPAAGGLEVTRVARKSPAEAAGIRRGDLVTTIDAVKMTTEEAYRNLLDRKSPDETLKITVTREGGGRQELSVKLGMKKIY